ncbi:DUF1446 domain protein [Metarhizium robertsii]|uniref:DUF1446 domain-containing protein n=2 Tax=Metarhizium robertsii TaxID=568076 RepID=E9FAG7_METRA|nr:DUF1446 domain-containing protein [Metarhizium robertsii ARSEF 23]EFY95317.1 DUF1446 domain-containing protein [Metarhizium robertsii ARSEF 23]EXU95720.1 DUF1446 domain protein [Metarhizium robertsii]
MTANPASQSRKRPIRIANCSGAISDPGVYMYNQAKYGSVDVITGDYLAEANMAAEAEKLAGEPDSIETGWVRTALEGLRLTLDLANEKRIKIIVNGGGLNPRGLAIKTHDMIKDKQLDLRVAYVDGDNLMQKVHSILPDAATASKIHLDSANKHVQLAEDALSFLQDPEHMPIVAANAYLGYRAIKRALDEAADIIICGRVADASPVLAAAAWWHGWEETDYDELAGALVAGHLIECSTYATGGNFSGAYKYPVDALINLGPPIAEVAHQGECVITKHEELGGFVTPDTVRCQLLYELQGNIYLNSDVKADLGGVKVQPQAAKNRVHVSGVRGHPPPPTTKLAVFYKGGYQLEILMNACGYATDHKWDVQEAQVKSKLDEWGLLDSLDVLDFQRVGTPQENPVSQLASTTYMRIFAQAKDRSVCRAVAGAWNFVFMSHFPGAHCSWDLRTLEPKPFLGYLPTLVDQAEISEAATVLTSADDASKLRRMPVGPPRITEPLLPRLNYETADPVPLASFGPKTMRPLGDVVLGRSGDKGGNVNLGLFVQTRDQFDWLRSFMTRDKLRELMRGDWRDWYFVERVELPGILAVHFVVYGALGRGVSSSRLLDNLGKGFGEFIRAGWVPVPTRFLHESAAHL